MASRRQRRQQESTSLAEQNRSLQTQVLQLRQQSFSGPLPPPEVLAEYNNVVPDGAERILAMAERQAAHRQRLEGRVVNSNTHAQTAGVYMAFVIAIIAFGCGTFLIYEGKDASGLGIILLDAASIIGSFIWSRRQQQRDRERT